MVLGVHGTLGGPVTLPLKALTHGPAPLTCPGHTKVLCFFGSFFQAVFSSPLT